MGTEWKMVLPINFGGQTYTDLQLSFLFNAATKGNCHEKIPVLSWTEGNYTGVINLGLTLRQHGQVRMGLRAIDNANNWSMFNMEFIIIP